MDKVAIRKTWKNEPIDNPKQIEISLCFTDEQFLKLKRGHIPQQMEDKWLDKQARRDDIGELAERLGKKFIGH